MPDFLNGRKRRTGTSIPISAVQDKENSCEDEKKGENDLFEWDIQAQPVDQQQQDSDRRDDAARDPPAQRKQVGSDQNDQHVPGEDQLECAVG